MAYSDSGELMAPVTNGKVEQYTSDVAKKRVVKGTDDLGKQEFLQLLVAQMQYQDPLNPSSDTEWISQMASFSSLEAMTNMGTTISNSQAMGMIGSTVVIRGDSGQETVGIVDFVTMSQGKARLSIDGNLYTLDQITKVVGADYVLSQKLPQVEKTAITYDHQLPQDQKIKLSMGIDEGAASGLTVIISGQEKAIESKYLTYDEDKEILTISKDAFKGLYAGEYKVMIGFNDVKSTISIDDVTLTVKGVRPEPEPEPEDPEDPGNTTDPEDPTDPDEGGKE